MGVPLVSIHFGGHLPGGDLQKRFGPNLNIGGSFMYKTKKNWLFGIESSYMFGRNVKEDVLSQLKNESGFIADNEGFPADLRVTERIQFFSSKFQFRFNDKHWRWLFAT
jgi:hypothetical protein